MRPHRRPRAVLFDAGNTLVFLDHAAVAATLGRLGLEITAEALVAGELIAVDRYDQRLREKAVHRWSDHVTTILVGAGVAETNARELLPALREEHDRFNLWRLVPPELPAALDRLRDARVRVAVVSNSEGKLDDLFTRVGLRERIELIVDSAIEGVSKPDPEIFRRALERLQVTAEEAIYLGDLPEVDVRGARAAGLTAALIDPRDRHAALDDVWRVPSTAALIDEVLALPT